jgi:cell division protein FtsL
MRSPSLLTSIALDLWRHLWVWLLWVVMLASALAVVTVTHSTRMLIAEREEIFQKRDQLNNEWRHLVIEQNTLAEHSRVEQIAREQLKMQRPNGNQEIIVKVP